MLSSRLRTPLLTAVLAAALLLPAAAANATELGAPGLFVERGQGKITLDDPTDDRPSRDIAMPVGLPPKDPVFSPDGTRVLISDVNAQKVGVADVNGSSQARIAFDFHAEKIYAIPWGSVWKDDDEVYTIASRWIDSRHLAHELYLIDVDAGTASRIHTLPGDLYWDYNDPALSPDGKVLALRRTIGAPGRGTISRDAVAVNVGNGTVTKIAHSDTAVTDHVTPTIDWHPGGNGYLIGKGTYKDGTMSVYDRDGNLVERASGQGYYRARFSPDGAHTWRQDGCTDDGCGVVVRRIPDANAEVAPDEPLEVLHKGFTRVSDWQAQKQPVVFVHGFAGARLGCPGDATWLPTIGAVGADLLEMRLAPDGSANADKTCGVKPLGLLEEAADLGPYEIQDIYGTTREWVEDLAGEERARMYVWDWRKDPREAVAGLDEEIAEALEQPDMIAAGVRKVAIVAHSMGGLVTRAYIDDDARAKRVARAVTVGTPYWGAPKALFPLAFGVELPGGSEMDAALPDYEFREFARTMTGLYALFPSSNHPQWLTAGGKPMVGADLRSHITFRGANPAAYDKGRAAHDEVLDGFERHGVDFRVLVGRGRPTITAVDLDGASVDVHYGDGDGTVPTVSARQGTNPLDPMGEDVTLMSVCRIGHMELTAKRQVQEPLEQFLLVGAPPRRTQGACGFAGVEVRFRDLDVPRQPQRRAAVPGAVPLHEIPNRDLGTVLELPEETIAVTGGDQPVDMGVQGTVSGLTVTPIRADGTKGEPRHFGPMDGAITVQTGGGATKVLEDGAPVEGSTSEPGPQPQPQPQPGPTPGGGGVEPRPADTPPAPPAPEDKPQPQPQQGGALTLEPLPRRGLVVRGGRVRVKVRCAAATACTGRVVLLGRKGTASAPKAVAVAAGSSAVVVLRPAKRALRSRTLRVRIESAGGAVTSKPVRLRR